VAQELFNSLDEDKSGAIDALELMHALEMLGLDVSWGEMEEAIKSVDVDGSGELDYEEFQMVIYGYIPCPPSLRTSMST
jgi:Ca2+-binding EF-hand superfamily protein